MTINSHRAAFAARLCQRDNRVTHPLLRCISLVLALRDLLRCQVSLVANGL
jgi:hypothetical protein